MMQCEDLLRHLDAFVDGELDPRFHLAVQRHVLQCSECHVVVDETLELRDRLRAEVGCVHASPHLRKRVLAILTDGAPGAALAHDTSPNGASGEGGLSVRPVRPSTSMQTTPAVVPLLQGRWRLWGVAASLCLAVLGWTSGRFEWVDDYFDRAGVLPLYEDVVRLHSKELPLEVGESDAARVSSWFRGKVEFPVRPIEFREPDAKLVGARIANVREYNAAVLYYTVGGHRVTVTVFASPKPVHRGAKRWKNRQGRELYYRNVGGYVVPVVQDRGLTYALTGDLDPQAQLRLAARARIVY